MLTIHLMNGPPGAGKDTAADYHVSNFGFRKIEMKDALRKVAFGIAHLYRDEKYLERHVNHSLVKMDRHRAGFCATHDLPVRLAPTVREKTTEIFMRSLEANHDLKNFYRDQMFGDLTLREFWIYLAEEVLKPIFGEDIFARYVINTIRDSGWQDEHVVVSDNGFRIELRSILKEFPDCDMKVMRIDREGCNFKVSGDSRNYTDHPVTAAYYGVRNPGTTKEDFYEVLDQSIKLMLGEK